MISILIGIALALAVIGLLLYKLHHANVEAQQRENQAMIRRLEDAREPWHDPHFHPTDHWSAGEGIATGHLKGCTCNACRKRT